MDISTTNNFNTDTIPKFEWYEETAPIYEEAWNMLKPMIRKDPVIEEFDFRIRMIVIITLSWSGLLGVALLILKSLI